jgi:hypothetical protein
MIVKIALKSLTVAVLTALAADIFALGGGTSNADFLKIGVGARPSAMGNAYAAVADDANAAFGNPAGIASISKWNVTLMHLIWFMNTSYEYASIIMPVDNMTNIGVSLNYFWVPPFDSTAFDSPADNPFSTLPLGKTPLSYDMALTFSIGRIIGNMYSTDFTIGNIALGANITYIGRKVLDTQLPSSISADLGLIANITESIRFGLVLADMGTAVGKDPSPFTLRTGLSDNFEITKDVGLLVTADVNKPIDLTNPSFEKWYVNAGAEMRIFGVLFVRGGYMTGQPDYSYTVGVGLGWPGIGSLDYAFVPNRELGDTHRMSATFSFGSEVPRPVIGAPRAPEKVNAAAGDKIVSVGWDPNPEANIIGYNIYYKQKNDQAYKKLNTDPVMEESKFKAVLSNDITYNFAVTAINNRKLESVYSEIVSATPQKYVPKKPSVVADVSAKMDQDTIVVTWNEAKEDFVAGYNLYYKKQGGDKFRKLNRGILRESKATLAGLKTDITYFFIITAVSKDGLESDYSGQASAIIKTGY